jgi:two-component system, sensor histidine kinase and response regulator
MAVPLTSSNISDATVMVVDDEPDNLNVLESMLDQAGFRTVVFLQGDWALAAARENPPDLVLLDIRMPIVDGYSLCRQFKADDTLHEIPILFLSALAAAEDIAKGFACGGVDYIMKPFHEAELLARVRTHIALRKAYRDLSQQHVMLKALERQRDTYVHMLVHDMRSPLMAMLGHLQLIEESEDAHLCKEDRRSLQSAIYCTRALGQMVSSVIDLSRMETQAPPLRIEATTARALFEAASSQVVPPSDAHTFETAISADCPQICCDVDLSVRVASNLIANALKHTPEGGTITLGACADPFGVRLWVKDDGVGIPRAFQTLIFEKYGVVGHTTERRVVSTGLGLAFCRMAVESQGGSIGIDSDEGRGSTFWLTLPADAVRS